MVRDLNRVTARVLPGESDVGVGVDEDLHVHQVEDGFMNEGHDSFENNHVGPVNVHFVLLPGMSLQNRKERVDDSYNSYN